MMTVRDNSENVSSELHRTRHEVDMINMMIQQLNDNFTLLRAQVRRHSLFIQVCYLLNK